MEGSAGNSDSYRGSSVSSSINSNSRRYGMQLSASNFFHSPISTLLEYSGILRTRSSSSSSAHPESQSDNLIHSGLSLGFQDHQSHNDSAVPGSGNGNGNGGEVSIRIIGAGEQDHVRDRVGSAFPSSTLGHVRELNAHNEVYAQPIGRTGSSLSVVSSASDGQGDSRSERGAGETFPESLSGGGVDGEAADVGGSNSRDSSYQRYDIQQAARWIEQVLPFSLLLLVVFIRQHLQGTLRRHSFSIL